MGVYSAYTLVATSPPLDFKGATLDTPQWLIEVGGMMQAQVDSGVVQRLVRRALAERPPGPGRVPPWRLLNGISRDPREFMTEMVDAYGDMVHVQLMHRHLTIVIHPRDIEEVLLTRSSLYVKDRMTHFLSFALGQGLLTSEDKPWKRHRRLIAPCMKRRQIAAYADAMVARTEQLLDRFEDGQTRDVHTDMMQLTLEIVAETLFGADVTDDAHRVGEILEDLMHAFMRYTRTWRRLLPAWEPLLKSPLVGLGTAQRPLDDLDEIIFRLIDRQGDADGDEGALVRLLLDARGDNGEVMDRQQIRDEAVTMFMAGHETTALALSYALWLLSQSPQVAARLSEEVSRVLDGRSATFEDVRALTWTEAIIKETLRLQPPAWAVGREARQDLSVGGYFIQKGTQVVIPIWRVHRDERWFEDPLSFRPERWLEGLEERLPRFAWFPFGGGPRTCIGNHFAMMEMVLVLATLAQHATFERAPGAQLETLPSVTLRPKGPVSMIVHRRP